MASPEQARANQLDNIIARTGKSGDELRALLLAQPDQKHAALRSFAQQALGLGYGDANRLAHFARGDGAEADAATDPLDDIYAADKAHLRPLHEAVMAAAQGFGDFEAAAKKGYVSLRRAKQFATLGPATKSAVELGLNLKEPIDSDRVKIVPPGGMCQYKVRLTAAEEIDAELVGWLRRAYDAAG